MLAEVPGERPLDVAGLPLRASRLNHGLHPGGHASKHGREQLIGSSPRFARLSLHYFLPPRLRQSGDFDFLRRAFAMMVSTIQQMQEMPNRPVRSSETNRGCRFIAIIGSLSFEQTAGSSDSPSREGGGS